MKIIVLDSTAKSIKAVLASSVATSNPDFVVAYADTSDNTFSELSSDGQLNGTTDVTLVGAPASGVKRAIKSITIYNRDTAAVTVSIKFDNGGTQRILQRVQLVSGETWHSDELTKLSPGGSDTQVQFNDLGTLAGSSNFTYNKTTSVLTLGANPVLTGGTANGVLYLNGSKVATTGSALTFDGTTFSNTGSGDRAKFGTGSRNLYIAGDSNGVSLVDGASQTGNGWYINTASSYVAGSIGSSEQMRLTSTGLGIGLGGGSPAVKLDVANASGRAARVGGFQFSGTTSSADGGNNLLGSGIYWNGSNLTATQTTGAVLQLGNGVIQFQTLSGLTAGNTYSFAPQLSLDSSGNLGLGVTPSAWGAGGNIDLSNAGSLVTQGPLANMGSNWYYSAGYKYKTASFAAQYAQNYGAHIWYTAPSGTAGSAITFTQAMTLDASGNLLVGKTSPSWSTSGRGLIEVNGSSSFFYGATINGTQTAYFGGSSSVAEVATVANIPLAFLTNNAERARITSGGFFKASDAGTYIGSTGAYHELVSSTGSATAAVYIRNTNATSPAGIDLSYSAASPNGTGNAFLYCQDSTALRMSIRSNGGIANFSANDVNLSDRREKTNFAPAKSYLDTICAIPVQTFNYIDQSEDDPGLTLGVVAQDVQAVAPELVMESNWGTEEDPKMRLSIYQTDLQYALMKCIQEQQALITSLTARVALLEGTQP